MNPHLLFFYSRPQLFPMDEIPKDPHVLDSKAELFPINLPHPVYPLAEDETDSDGRKSTNKSQSIATEVIPEVSPSQEAPAEQQIVARDAATAIDIVLSTIDEDTAYSAVLSKMT